MSTTTPKLSGARDGEQRRLRRGGRWLWLGAVALVVTAVLFGVFHANSHTNAIAGRHDYQVGTPGVGQLAPTFTLPASTGNTISLASWRGKTVLLYFQEGIGCEPCWAQMKDLESAAAAMHTAGVDQIISITTQPVSLLSQKAHDEGIATPVLADTNLAVSHAYAANRYGMGAAMDGHTFLLVGPDGKIQWRADYGGAPKYTMYVRPAQLLADMQAGRVG